MKLVNITPLILTYNEAFNIAQTCSQLTWAERIVVIDSGSTDETVDILSKFPNVEVLQRVFDTHAQQWNFGISQISSEWILTLDADYFITDQLKEEFLDKIKDSETEGYYIPFRYCVFGKPLRGTLLPPRLALFKNGLGKYIDDGHTQLLELNGKVGNCHHPILHDDRKPLSRWLWAQDRYIQLEVKKILSTPNQDLSLGDKIRKQKLIAPFIILVYCLILKGGILDGWQGWFYAFQRLYAELLLSLRLIESELSKP